MCNHHDFCRFEAKDKENTASYFPEDQTNRAQLFGSKSLLVCGLCKSHDIIYIHYYWLNLWVFIYNNFFTGYFYIGETSSMHNYHLLVLPKVFEDENQVQESMAHIMWNIIFHRLSIRPCVGKNYLIYPSKRGWVYYLLELDIIKIHDFFTKWLANALKMTLVLNLLILFHTIYLKWT